MRTYVAPKGSGKTELLIRQALYLADDGSNMPVYVISPTTKKASLLKKRMLETNNGSIPKNIIFEGADAFFSKGPSRVKTRTTARFFFDDLDDSLKALIEKTINGKAVVSFVTATEESK